MAPALPAFPARVCFFPLRKTEGPQAAGFVTSLRRTGFWLCRQCKAPVMHATCTPVCFAGHTCICIKTHQPPLEVHKPTGDCATPSRARVRQHSLSFVPSCPWCPGLKSQPRLAPVAGPAVGCARAPPPSMPECAVHVRCGRGAGSLFSPGRPWLWLPAWGRTSLCKVR